ncbi:hypothetical protein HK102_005026, partial [Quaeritorhiza haematococci]
FFQTREKFYEQRQRLIEVLNEDLNRMDFDRKAEFQRKFKAFEIGKHGIFVDDITNMRQKASGQRKTHLHRILHNHPWFKELLNKVVMTGGIKRKIGEYERLLLNRIRGIIEDQIPFTQQTYIKMMKVIPTSEFQKEEIQRIIRL